MTSVISALMRCRNRVRVEIESGNQMNVPLVLFYKSLLKFAHVSQRIVDTKMLSN